MSARLVEDFGAVMLTGLELVSIDPTREVRVVPGDGCPCGGADEACGVVRFPTIYTPVMIGPDRRPAWLVLEQRSGYASSRIVEEGR